MKNKPKSITDNSDIKTISFKGQPYPYGGVINSVIIGNTAYKLQASIAEVYPMTCPKCGGSLELHHGEGACEYCGTKYTTYYKIVERRD